MDVEVRSASSFQVASGPCAPERGHQRLRLLVEPSRRAFTLERHGAYEVSRGAPERCSESLAPAVAPYLFPRPPKPPMPPTIIHTITPIMSMQGIRKSRKAGFAKATERTTARSTIAVHIHIVFFE